MSHPTILVQREDSVCTLTLNRPEAMNSLSLELLDAMHAALDEVAFDPAVSCVVIVFGASASDCVTVRLGPQLRLAVSVTW